MYILNHFAFYILYLVVFIISYFATERFFSWKVIFKLKWPKFLEDFSFGLFIGVITLLSQLINYSIYGDFELVLFVSTLILLSIFKTQYAALSSIIPGFIYMLFKKYNDSGIFVIISFSIFLSLLILYIKTFIRKDYEFLSYFTIFMIAFVASLGISVYAIYDQNITKSFSKVALIFPFSFIGYLIMNYMVNFALSSKTLYDSSRYSFLNYYRPSIAVMSINQYLLDRKIKTGYLVIFKLIFDQKYANKINEKTNHDIEMHFYDLLQKKLTNGILFNLQKNENGFFIPVDKFYASTNAINSHLSNIIKNLNKKYKWSDTESPLKMSAQFGISKYGIDSQSVSKLIEYSSFALKEQPRKEDITFFEWKIYHSFLLDNKNINEMDSAMQLDDFANIFIPLFDLTKKEHFATYSSVQNISEFQSFETVSETSHVKQFHNTFDRYFASSAILNAKGEKIIVDYSPTIFENHFILERFLDFFDRNNIKYNSIFLLFRSMSLNKVKFDSVVNKEIKKLKKLGFKFIFSDNSKKSKIKKIINVPDFIYVKAKNIKKSNNVFPEVPKICFDISSQLQIKNAVKNNIKILGGSLLEQEFNFLKFGKQSKIYLETTLKGENNE